MAYVDLIVFAENYSRLTVRYSQERDLVELEQSIGPPDEMDSRGPVWISPHHLSQILTKVNNLNKKG